MNSVFVVCFVWVFGGIVLLFWGLFVFLACFFVFLFFLVYVYLCGCLTCNAFFSNTFFNEFTIIIKIESKILKSVKHLDFVTIICLFICGGVYLYQCFIQYYKCTNNVIVQLQNLTTAPYHLHT